MSSAAPDLTSPIPVVILNWNGFDDTVECLAALDQQSFRGFHVHLVDNGSDGGDHERLQARFESAPWVTVTANERNLGFTGGVNRALERLLARDPPPPAVVLLNNDTVPDADWLEQLTRTWRSSDARLVASRMINHHEPDRLDNAGHIWLDSGEILPRGTDQPPSSFGEPAELVGGCAGALLIDTRLFRTIGLLDDFFETGYEDAEFGLRAFLAGFPTVYEPRARVYHKISRSIDRIRSPRYAMRIQTNIHYTYLKLAPWPLIVLNSPWLVLKTAGVITVAALAGRRALVRAHWRALADTWRNRDRILSARRAWQGQRRISAWRAWRAQRFFLPRYLAYFRRYILTRQPTVFER